MDGKYQYVYDAKRGMNKIYGGKLVENICQGLARCIIGEQMILISQRYRPVLTVHDAVACVVPESEAQEAKEFGIVNRVVPAADLSAEVDAIAARLAAKPTKVLGWAKHLLHSAADNPRAVAFYARQGFVEVGRGANPRSGLPTLVLEWRPAPPSGAGAE